MKTESEQIRGSLESIRFQNEKGFVIGAFRDKDGKPFNALGNMVNPQVCLEYTLTGYWDANPKFGEQFRFDTYETTLPSDHNGIFKYIVRICKFVGTSVGNALVNAYGSNTLEIMKTDPGRIVKDISGITLDRANTIQKALLDNEANEKVMVELESLLDIPGMRKSLPAEMVKIHRANAAEVVKENPYILTSFKGVGFPLADRVALNIGFQRDSLFRKEAAVIHVLKENERDGSTWIHKRELLNSVRDIIQVRELEKGVESLAEKGIVMMNKDGVSFYSTAQNEQMIANTLIRLEVA